MPHFLSKESRSLSAFCRDFVLAAWVNTLELRWSPHSSMAALANIFKRLAGASETPVHGEDFSRSSDDCKKDKLRYMNRLKEYQACSLIGLQLFATNRSKESETQSPSAKAIANCLIMKPGSSRPGMRQDIICLFSAGFMCRLRTEREHSAASAQCFFSGSDVAAALFSGHAFTSARFSHLSGQWGP